MGFRKSKAFTIIEILVVIVIIGVLASIIMVNVVSSQKKSTDTRRIGDLKEIEKAIKLFHADKFTYPSSPTPGRAGYCLGIGDGPVRNDSNKTIDASLRPYINPVPQDPKQTNFNPNISSCGNATTATQYYYYYDDQHPCYPTPNPQTVATLHIQTLNSNLYNNSSRVCPNITGYINKDGQFDESAFRIAFDEPAP